MFQQMIEKAVNKSQHCQRNWDLSQRIPKKDLQTIETSITACPSKQNYVFYKPYMITHRETIDKLYHASDGFALEDGTTKKNSQVLANLLVAFVECDDYLKQLPRNTQGVEYEKTGNIPQAFKTDRQLAIGIAAGYLNLTSSLLGYSTGCCTCFDNKRVKEILNIDEDVHLMMGVGIPDAQRSRREHHKERDFTFPTFSKSIDVVKI